MNLRAARIVFDGLHVKNVGTWSAMQYLEEGGTEPKKQNSQHTVQPSMLPIADPELFLPKNQKEKEETVL